MQIKNRQQLLIIVAVSAVALLAADKVIRAPLASAWDRRAARITELRKLVATSKTYRVRETGLRNHWRDISGKTLTNETSTAEQQVFQAIDAWAQNTGVTINAITPQWKHDSEDYMTYECRIDAAGDIDRLTRFLYRVEREPMALKFESIELSARDKEGRQLSLGLQLSALVLNPPPK